MTEPEINEQIAKFEDDWNKANIPADSDFWLCVGKPRSTNYSQDETALRQALGKLSEEQKLDYVNALKKIWIVTPNNLGLSTAGDALNWLLFEVPTATKARVLAEVVKEGQKNV